MSNNHFSYFRVKNFKRFKDLEVKDIGQFNLVLGDNNVGKTSLLEALLVDSNPSNVLNKFSKNSINRIQGELTLEQIFEYYTNKESEDLDQGIEFISDNFSERDFDRFEIKTDKLSKIEIQLSYYELEIISNRYNNPYKAHLQTGNSYGTPQIRLNLVLLNTCNLHELSRIYSEKIQSNRILKTQLVKTLEKVIDSISSVDISISGSRPSLLIERKDSVNSIPLSSYGDGVQKLFRIFIELVYFTNSSLMIDEIDAGIHYSRMKDYWKVILQSANENNVQIFATTHNKECMESYKLALEELGPEYMEKARTITLKESREKGDITAYTAKFEVLQSAIKLGNELR